MNNVDVIPTSHKPCNDVNENGKRSKRGVNLLREKALDSTETIGEGMSKYLVR